MTLELVYRAATVEDAVKLSILYKTVYIQTYGTEGVSDEFANFIVRQFAVDRLRSILELQPGNIIVASYKNNLVGVAEIEFNKRCPVGNLVAPELNKLYILDWFCGKGIGYNLMRLAEARVRQQGERQMWLWVLETNRRAVDFYHRQGYRDIGKASFQMEVNSYMNDVMIKQLSDNAAMR